jgi:hypothetical protein
MGEERMKGTILKIGENSAVEIDASKEAFTVPSSGIYQVHGSGIVNFAHVLHAREGDMIKLGDPEVIRNQYTELRSKIVGPFNNKVKITEKLTFSKATIEKQEGKPHADFEVCAQHHQMIGCEEVSRKPLGYLKSIRHSLIELFGRL